MPRAPKHAGTSIANSLSDIFFPAASSIGTLHLTGTFSLAYTCFSVTCSDSVSWLAAQTDLQTVDLFYLDSWDVKWDNDHDSAEHHLREFLAIESFIKPGAIVAIDDNARFLQTGTRTGKGRRVVEYLEAKGIFPVYDAYQIIYKF